MNPKKTEQDSGLSSRASSAKTATPDPHQNRHGLARSAGCWSEQEVKPGDRGTFHGTCPVHYPTSLAAWVGRERGKVQCPRTLLPLVLSHFTLAIHSN